MPRASYSTPILGRGWEKRGRHIPDYLLPRGGNGKDGKGEVRSKGRPDEAE